VQLARIDGAEYVWSPRKQETPVFVYPDGQVARSDGAE